jgi:glycosyltransferase involved in cell wall biosynthesis
MKKKRILLLGDATQVHLIRWEAYLRDNGYETLTASLEPIDGIAGPRRRIRVAPWLPDALRYPMAVPAVRRMIGDFKPDLVNAHFIPNYGVIAAGTGFRPWILTTWGSDVMVLPGRSPFQMVRARTVIRRASAITSDAHVMTQRLVELGAQPDRITTFPMGVDRRAFFSGVSDRGEDLRLVSDRKLEDVYNIETILAAVPYILRSEPKATLTVAGDGRSAARLRETAERLAPSAIRFVGNMAHAAMPDLLRVNHVYVSVSLSDTTSVSLLEAMACGLFPVVSDIPANREWIVHGTNGFVVPARDERRLAEAVVNAWRDPALRRSAAQLNARTIADRADWHRNMGVLTRLFDQVLESPH